MNKATSGKVRVEERRFPAELGSVDLEKITFSSIPLLVERLGTGEIRQSLWKCVPTEKNGICCVAIDTCTN